MNWLIDVQGRYNRGNKVLFPKDSEFLSELSDLIRQQNHRVVVLWALELADEVVEVLHERYPDETRLMNAVIISRDWAAGRVKMRIAQRAILDAHAVAKEITSSEDIALCHAVGQACGTVHAAGHALGFPIYDLTAIVRRYGIPACREPIESRMQHYFERLFYWGAYTEKEPLQWADFLSVN